MGSYGCVIFDNRGKQIWETSGRVEHDMVSNNVAEATGLYVLLCRLKDLAV